MSRSTPGITHVVRENRRAREAAERGERLAKIREQVADGRLVIRQATKEERASWPAPRTDKAAVKAKGRRRLSLAVPYAGDSDYVAPGEDTIEEAA